MQYQEFGSLIYMKAILNYSYILQNSRQIRLFIG